VRIAREVRPDVVTLVPEKRQERTTEGGLALEQPEARAQVASAIEQLSAAGIPVSLFIDPTETAVRLSRTLRVPRIELHTGDYCEGFDAVGRSHTHELGRLRGAAQLGHSLGLHVAAGHGLDYANVEPLVAIPEVCELNIGHALVARAVFVGLEAAVREMLAVCRRGRAAGAGA
jgi:pyridoxine 5-phosphate synthase